MPWHYILHRFYHTSCGTKCSSEALVSASSEAAAYDGVLSSCRGWSSAHLQGWWTGWFSLKSPHDIYIRGEAGQPSDQNTSSQQDWADAFPLLEWHWACHIAQVLPDSLGAHAVHRKVSPEKGRPGQITAAARTGHLPEQLLPHPPVPTQQEGQETTWLSEIWALAKTTEETQSFSICISLVNNMQHWCLQLLPCRAALQEPY